METAQPGRNVIDDLISIILQAAAMSHGCCDWTAACKLETGDQGLFTSCDKVELWQLCDIADLFSWLHGYMTRLAPTVPSRRANLSTKSMWVDATHGRPDHSCPTSASRP